MARYFHIITYGCQMNVFDSLRIADALRTRLNIQETTELEQADVVIINTCSVREKPEEKVYATLTRVLKYKRRRPHMVIGVAGCVPRHAGRAIMDRFDFVDFVMGPDHVSEVASIVSRAMNHERVIATSQARRGQYVFPAFARDFRPGPTAFLTIIKGCNKTCSYCIVPFTRGPEQSKSPRMVMDEVKALVNAGAIELTLLGQNVNSYGHDLDEDVDFVNLLEAVASVKGLKRLRFVTSHPVDANDELLRAFSRIPNLMPYLHLPLQAGSDRVLRAMKRGYTLDDYLRKVDVLRSASPQVALATDMIVGFPGETAEDFDKTLSAVRRIEFDQMFSFKYSPRPHSAAARKPDDVKPGEKARRLQALQELHEEIQSRRMASLQDSVQEVLVEGLSRRGRQNGVGQVFGRTPANWVVNVDAEDPDDLVGKIVRVKVTQVMRHSLKGRIIDRPEGMQAAT